jgi:hypothetical protein
MSRHILADRDKQHVGRGPRMLEVGVDWIRPSKDMVIYVKLIGNEHPAYIKFRGRFYWLSVSQIPKDLFHVAYIGKVTNVGYVHDEEHKLRVSGYMVQRGVIWL